MSFLGGENLDPFEAMQHQHNQAFSRAEKNMKTGMTLAGIFMGIMALMGVALTGAIIYAIIVLVQHFAK